MENGSDTKRDVRKITFEFNDSSVPPKYHRSYSISITENESRLEVTSYWFLLTDSTRKVNEDQWMKAKELSDKLQKEGNFTTEGITGGTSSSIKLDVTEGKGYNLIWDNRNEDKIQNSAMELKAHLVSIWPDLHDLKMEDLEEDQMAELDSLNRKK